LPQQIQIVHHRFQSYRRCHPESDKISLRF
jgi:hypothetical protein